MKSELLLNQQQISDRIAQLGEQITNWAKTKDDKIVVVWLAEGAILFTADLIRQIDCDLTLVSIKTSSYGKNLKSTGTVNLEYDFSNLQDKYVLLIDDIFDTGLTLQTVIAKMRQANAKEIKTCVLLRKLDIKTNAQIPDYIGFDIPDKFVFGYGLDAYESHRNLKEIHYITEQ